VEKSTNPDFHTRKNMSQPTPVIQKSPIVDEEEDVTEEQLAQLAQERPVSLKRGKASKKRSILKKNRKRNHFAYYAWSDVIHCQKVDGEPCTKEAKAKELFKKEATSSSEALSVDVEPRRVSRAWGSLCAALEHWPTDLVKIVSDYHVGALVSSLFCLFSLLM
jgi:hypothetical protein